MTHTAFARKYRPRRFSELISQGHVAKGLGGAVAKNRVAHGYLLAGPRGTGKTTAARILAMALNCERRDRDSDDGEPCGQCDSCVRVWSGAANLDVVEIDAASNRGVDDARELRERAMYAASTPDGYKVYIVDEAHMLTREAWNALLKILEEPPPRVVFVFATTEPQKIANMTTAVLSRLQRFDLRRIGPAAICDRLREVADAEHIAVEDDAIALLARSAQGAMRDALSMFDQVVVFGEGPVTALQVREALGLIDEELYAEVLVMVADHNAADVFSFVARLVEQGADLVEFVNGLGETLRALLVQKLGGRPEGLTDSLRVAVDRVQAELSQGDLLRMLKLLEDTETSIRRSPNARLHVETLLLHWALLDRTVEIAEILSTLRGSAGSPPREEPSRPRSIGNKGRESAIAARPSVREQPVSAADGGPPTLERLITHWDAVLDTVAQRNPLIREILSDAVPKGLAGGMVTLELSDEMKCEGLIRSKAAIEEAIAAVLGSAVHLHVTTVSQVPKASEPKRQTVDGDREARLRSYRDQDPALDAMVESLDLKVVD